MHSLIDDIARSIARDEAKRTLFFGYHLPFGRYLIGYQTAFEVGVVLGYAYRKRLNLFAKLFSKPGREQELISYLQELAETRLSEVREARTFFDLDTDTEEVGEVKYFFDLAMYPEEERIIANWRKSKFSEAQIEDRKAHDKMPLKQASDNFFVAVSTGLGFGSRFPELTEQLWKAEHERPIDREKLAKWWKGPAPDATDLQPLTLDKRQEQLLPLVELFVSEYQPDLLSEFHA